MKPWFSCVPWPVQPAFSLSAIKLVVFVDELRCLTVIVSVSLREVVDPAVELTGTWLERWFKISLSALFRSQRSCDLCVAHSAGQLSSFLELDRVWRSVGWFDRVSPCMA